MNSSVQGTTNTLMLAKVRIAGILCAVGGAGWLVTGLLSSAISQPHSVAYALMQVPWIIVQVLLLVGALGLAFLGWGVGVVRRDSLKHRPARACGFRAGGDPRVHPCRGQYSAAGRCADYSDGYDACGYLCALYESLGRLAEIHSASCRGLPLLGEVPFHCHHRRTKPAAIAGWGLTWCLLGYAIWSSTAEESPSRVR